MTDPALLQGRPREAIFTRCRFSSGTRHPGRQTDTSAGADRQYLRAGQRFMAKGEPASMTSTPDAIILLLVRLTRPGRFIGRRDDRMKLTFPISRTKKIIQEVESGRFDTSRARIVRNACNCLIELSKSVRLGVDDPFFVAMTVDRNKLTEFQGVVKQLSKEI